MDLKTQVVIIGGGITGMGIARDRDAYLGDVRAPHQATLCV